MNKLVIAILSSDSAIHGVETATVIKEVWMVHAYSNMPVLISGPPGEPAGVHVPPESVTSHEVEVRWTQGDSRGSTINFYTVESQTIYETKWTESVAG